MDVKRIHDSLDSLAALDTRAVHQSDFLLTWERTMDELLGVCGTAEMLRTLRGAGLSTRLFDSGLAVSIFRDHSTRTRFSFASAANLLGLGLADMDEEKSQIAHGETVRETANMICFLAEAVGIRDDIFLGHGHTYMKEFAAALQDGFDQGVLPTRPGVVNLQCDVDHPTQSMADLLHLIHHFGGLGNLKGKRIAMTWAYSPSYGKPMSVPQGIIGLLTRFGMDVVLAYPEGYNLIPEVEELAARQASESGGSFARVDSMAEAFEGADIVYPKSWAPYAVMQERTALLTGGDKAGLKDLEARCLENNKRHLDWQCDQGLMAATSGGEGLYMHCLPADISGVSCERGEVEARVFEKYRIETYKEAGWKPYVIAAMILLSRQADPAGALRTMLERGHRRML